MKKLNKQDIMILLKKLQNAEGTDSEQSEWIWQIQNSVPFYQEIVDLLFWTDKKLSAEEIYMTAEEKHKPIIL